MATIFKIKRRVSGAAGAPAALKSGELAHNEVDNIIYIGRGDDGSGNATSIVPVAGNGGFVALSGAQTVTGVKTFSSSPVVPTPTTDMQAATKKYVDDAMSGAGLGDMLKAVYDPTNKNADAFSMDNMAETATKKILTDAERAAIVANSTDRHTHSNKAVLDATTASYTTALNTKLSGIETAADVTDAANVGSSIHGSTAKITPVDADTVPLIDSAAANVLKKITWANIKATLKTYFDTLYATASHAHAWDAITSKPTTLAGYGITDAASSSHTHTFASLTSKPTTLSGYGITDAIPASQKGAANGVAELDAGGKVPTAQLPETVLGAMKYQSTWNASTNVPALSTANAGNKGHYYIVAVAGATNLDGTTDWKIGDWVVSDGVTWAKIDNTDQVTSVAGRQGAVVLSTADISGLGTMATQAASNVNITGGSIDGVTIDGGTF